MGYELSPAKRKRLAEKRRREEDRWAARSGPVVVRSVGEPVAEKGPDTRTGDGPSRA